MGTLTVNQNKLQKRLRRQAGEAVADFNMIEDGDKVMVCLSGGKDSYTMLDVLMHLQKVAPIKFEIVAVNMDQKQPGFPEHVLPAYLKELGIEYHIVEKDTYSVVKDMLQEWDRKTPGRTESIFRSLQNVIPSQLADRNLFDFTSLKIDESAASRFVNVVNL
jgi:tRNA(Ile)-lysidine synthase TilS/MesJ